MAAIQTHLHKSADQFLSTLRRSNDFWWQHGRSTTPWVFRGIGDASNWRLIPSAWRNKNNRLKPLKDSISKLQLPGWRGDHQSIYRDYDEWCASEREALYQFANVANESGHLIEAQNLKFDKSPLVMRTLPKIQDDPPWKLWPDVSFMALAQHHGVPTRLLDWTRNPIIAAFFAAHAEFRDGVDTSSSICVYAFNTTEVRDSSDALKPFGSFFIDVLSPPLGNNQFMHSQGGVFTEILGAQEYFRQNGRWPALEDVLSSYPSTTPLLIKYELGAEHVQRLLLLLDREGINKSVIMPTLDNMAKTAIDRWAR